MTAFDPADYEKKPEHACELPRAVELLREIRRTIVLMDSRGFDYDRPERARKAKQSIDSFLSSLPEADKEAK